MHPYSYQKTSFPVNMNQDIKNDHWARYAVDFPTAHPSVYHEYNTVRGLYYQPIRKNPVPLVIMIHGMGDYSVVPWKALAPSLAKRGIAAFVLYHPYHSSRIPATIKQRIPNLTAQEWFEGLQISVVDIFQVLDWAAGKPELYNARNAVMGVSYGGVVSAIAMGIDVRIKVGIFVVTGGNAGKINLLSKSKAYSKVFQLKEAEFSTQQTTYFEYLENVKLYGFENVESADFTFQIDPMTFADRLKNRPLLMLNAARDKYVPREAVLDFWQACGKPPLKWFPGGHLGIWAFYPLIAHLSINFLEANI
jgi:alpha-beta hydrolase superfamily lysophospholipase